jgi:purine-binding chemotaxis protein CheW
MTTVPQPIDWTRVYQQIEEARRISAEGWNSSDEEIKRILKARAKTLASPPAQVHAEEERLTAVMFRLSGETYALELAFVREVYPLKGFTPVPCTPGFVVGIINVRGQILSIVDLRHFFELPKVGLSELNKVIILRNEEMEVGILADEILGIASILRNKLKPSLPTLSGIRDTYLRGVTPEHCVVLDGGRILSDQSLVVQEQVEG